MSMMISKASVFWARTTTPHPWMIRPATPTLWRLNSYPMCNTWYWKHPIAWSSDHTASTLFPFWDFLKTQAATTVLLRHLFRLPIDYSLEQRLSQNAFHIWWSYFPIYVRHKTVREIQLTWATFIQVKISNQSGLANLIGQIPYKSRYRFVKIDLLKNPSAAHRDW